MHKRWAALVAAVLVTLGPAARAAENAMQESPEQRDTRLAWWREARFGLFIHWGVYAVPAGTYRGQQIGGIGEWIMHQAKIPVDVYRGYARQFNPVRYDPDAWARLAVEAGMKYLVITSKHHDGFALFNSAVTGWDVVDATPYGRDLLAPLAEACQRHGLKLGFYYSQAQDWNHPGGAAAGGHWDPKQDGSMDDYIDQIAIPQVREILTNYGPIAILWWDTPVDMTPERAARLYPLTELVPGIITNNRLGGGFPGDSETPEQYIPATGYPGGRDFEVCMTMNDTWGFKSYDHNWKSVETLLRNLIDIASKGGNYLLNVGPTAEGEIPEPSQERLRAVGAWMRVNSEAIYGTRASVFRRLGWGRCTTKPAGDNTLLYLHVFNWPADGKLLVPGLRNDIVRAYRLADHRAVSHARQDDGVRLDLGGGEAPDAISTTIVVEVVGAPEVEQVPLSQAADGTVTLPAAEAELHGTELRYEAGGNRDNIGFWNNPAEWVEFPFRVTRPGRFTVTADIAAHSGSRFELIVGTQRLSGTAPVTGDYGKFETLELGTVELGEGRVTLEFRPVAEGWSPINLRRVVLTPQ